MILMVDIYFADYLVVVVNANLMFAIVALSATSPNYTDTRCTEQTHVMSTPSQVAAGVVTTAAEGLLATTHLTTGPGIAPNVHMIFVATALVSHLE